MKRRRIDRLYHAKCPYCKMKSVLRIAEDGMYSYVYCKNCDARGPTMMNPGDAKTSFESVHGVKV